jgi:hypothetical protein
MAGTDVSAEYGCMADALEASVTRTIAIAPSLRMSFLMNTSMETQMGLIADRATTGT